MHKVKSLPFLNNKILKDELTGAWSEAGFKVNGKKLLEKNADKNYIIVKFDIDKYRELDNRYDDNQGEKLLCAIVESIDSWLVDKYVMARLASDRFILMAEKSETFMEDLEGILQETAARQGVKKMMVSVSFTYGAYEVLNKKEAVSDMMNKVIIAHNMAIRNPKKNIIWYNKGLEQILEQERYFNNQLMGAIEKGELRVYLQHQISMANDHKIAAEALIRWVMPNGRIQYPDSFIPQFERNGMILYLDIYVLENVCRYINAIRSRGHESVQIAVNISHNALLHEDFCERFLGVIERFQVPHESICVEVGEVAFVESDSLAIKNLIQLKEAGVVVAMDAFASGYSCLRMLPSLPVDILKMDRQFLLAKAKNEKVEIVMESIVTLAHDLGLKVTCEGVEHLKDLEFLQSIGCDVVQGYYLMKPIPNEEFIQSLSEVEEFVQSKFQEMRTKDHE